MRKAFPLALTLALLFVAPIVCAQAIDAQSQQGYQTPDDALYAALLTVGSYTVSAVVPVQTYVNSTHEVTWNVIRQADAGECHEPSQDQVWPVAWTGSDICGGGLGSFLTHTETDLPTLRTWILSNLDSGQRQTMFVHQTVGVQRANVRWLVAYQTHQAFCY